MLLLRECHRVAGRHEYEFEDAIRDEWMTTLAKTDYARLLYYLNVAHGSGESYNVVTDTVVGVNVRLWDNILQAIFIGVSIVLGMIIGGLLWGAGGAVGGFLAGLIGGFLVSGIFLMIYRAIRHARGKHD